MIRLSNSCHTLTQRVLRPLARISRRIKWKILYYGDYNVGHRERQRWFLKASENIILRNGYILDAGCGRGDYTMMCGYLYPDSRVLGLDFSGDNISKCFEKAEKASLRKVHFEVGDLRNLKYQNMFDFILCIDVLEHLAEDEAVLERFWQALTKKGYLYIHVPLHVQKYYFNKFRQKFATPDHVIDGYNSEDIKRKVLRTGFAIEKEYPTHREIARLAYEIYELFRTKRRNRLLLRPLLDAFLWVDRRFPYAKTQPAGLGLLARKQ
jgi:trans-aconitate methyltransferase